MGARTELALLNAAVADLNARQWAPNAMAGTLANALDEALDLLAEKLPEDHAALRRLNDILAAAECEFARMRRVEIAA